MTSPSQTGIGAFGRRRIGRINARGLWTLYEKEVRRFLKVWMQTVAAPAVQALLFFVIFTIVLGGSGRVGADVVFTQFLAPGLVTMALLQNAFQNTSSSLIISKIQGTIVDVLMPPLSPGELTLGYVAGGVTRGLIVAAALVAAFALLPMEAVVISHVWAIVFFSVAAAVMLSLVGILTGIWAEKFDHVATITNFVVAPLTLLSGTFYSVERLKERMGAGAEWLEPVLAANPVFYAIDGVRYGFIGSSDSNLAAGLAVMLLVDAVLWALVYRALKTGWRIKA